MSNLIFKLDKVRKSYEMENKQLEVLRGIDLQIQEGEAVCIVGSSGAGKSTLLHLLGGLDLPTSGDIYFKDDNLAKFDDFKISDFRGRKIGFVFQFHHLLGEFTALENVLMPAKIAGIESLELKQRAESLLVQFGLAGRLKHFPSELSGGEQQRTAVARALIRNPQVLLADEPTGNLDTQNAKAIQDLFFELHKKFQLTMIVVTHDMQFASRFSRVLKIRDGIWER